MSGFAIRSNSDDVEKAFKQLRKEVLSELRPALRKAAEPVRAEATSLFEQYDARSAAGYKVRVRLRGVAVEQTLKRTTGTRPDFGRLQMEKALDPALKAKEPEVMVAVEEMIAMSAKRSGF